MAKGITDILKDLTSAVMNDGARPVSKLAGSVQEMEALLEEVSGSNPEAIEHLAPLLEQTRAMNAMVAQIVEAEAAGDSEAVLALSQDFAATAGVPGFEPETDPDHIALEDALEDADDTALAAVLGGLGDLNRTLGQYEQTPLGMALSAPGRSAARVQLFLDRGARADFATPEGYTPLHYIGDYMWVGDTPDTLESLTGIVTTLVAAGADIEARTDWGWTPLVRAAFEGSALEMRALLAAGADPNGRVEGEGPSVSANKSLLVLVAADPEKVALLLEHGADVAASGVEAFIASELATEDPDGYTPYWDGLRASREVIAAARKQ